jgi:hypothetical protein
MISYKWELQDGGKIFLEKDSHPSKAYPCAYQLRYEAGKVNEIVDYNLNAETPFCKKYMSRILLDSNVNTYSWENIDDIVNEANVLVALGRR